MITDELSKKWLSAKKAEEKAKKNRLDVEAEIIEGLSLPIEGSTTDDGDAFKVKVTTKITRSVDADKAVEIATTSGRDDLLNKLFRWKPEVNKAIWDAEDPEIIKIFSAAVTAKPAKPSISIEKK